MDKEQQNGKHFGVEGSVGTVTQRWQSQASLVGLKSRVRVGQRQDRETRWYETADSLMTC